MRLTKSKKFSFFLQTKTYFVKLHLNLCNYLHNFSWNMGDLIGSLGGVETSPTWTAVRDGRSSGPVAVIKTAMRKCLIPNIALLVEGLDLLFWIYLFLTELKSKVKRRERNDRWLVVVVFSLQSPKSRGWKVLAPSPLLVFFRPSPPPVLQSWPRICALLLLFW